MSEYIDEIENNSRVEVLNLFRNEIMDEAVDFYATEHGKGEKIEWSYRGPMAQTFTGPASTSSETNIGKYRLEGRNWKINFEVIVTDAPYDIDDMINEKGALDTQKLIDSFTNFRPEDERSRLISFSPEASGEHDNDRWYGFKDNLEDFLQPERTYQVNDYDSVHHFDLKDTKTELEANSD